MRYLLAIIFLQIVFFPYDNFAQTTQPVSTYSGLPTLGVAGTTGLIMPYASQSIATTQRSSETYSRYTSTGVRQPQPNRRTEYLGAKVHGLQGRQRIAEQIGDMGARTYARNMGFQPLYEGLPGQGRGFDAIYRNQSNQIIVIEAKGGSSSAKVYRGFRQGTAEYALAVAHDRLRSPAASFSEKQGARAVNRAHSDGRLVLQEVRTGHVYGTPGTTHVTTTSGRLIVPSPIAAAHGIAMKTGGVVGLFVATIDSFGQIRAQDDIDFMQLASNTGLGFASAYAGSFSGMSVGALARSSSPRFLATVPVVSGLAGSVIAGGLYSYGGYLIGLHTLQSAHQGMGLALIGGAAGYLTGYGMVTAASAFGAASTGTAISSLSGVAATNASLAWWGGGALSAGGGGVAVGSMVILGSTVAVAIVVPSIYIAYKHFKDLKDEEKRIEGMIQAGIEHCKKGLCTFTDIRPGS